MENVEEINTTFFSKNKGTIIMLIIVIILQTIIFIGVGMEKSYMSIDEVRSYALAQYDKFEIYDNEDFYNTWHTKEYYKDYISLNDKQIFNFIPAWKNQINVNHPPLYYLLLRIAMCFSLNHFSMWTGLGLNIIIYSFITVFIYLIMNKLLGKGDSYDIESIIIAFVSSITLVSLSSVMYIGMYALATLNILIITYLHIKLYKEFNRKNLILIGIATIIGYLTHYHYLIYVCVIFLTTAIVFLTNQDNEKFIKYTLALDATGIISLIIWPYSVKHFLFTDSGKEFINNLVNYRCYLDNLFHFIHIINLETFNKSLRIILGIIIIAIILRCMKKNRIKIEISEYFKFIYIPTVIYFIVLLSSSYFREIRYLFPISALIFVSTIYITRQLLQAIVHRKDVFKIIVTLLILVAIKPNVSVIKPDYLYRKEKEFMYKIENQFKNVPAIYWGDMYDEQMFLGDILPFTKINESYVMKESEYNINSLKHILKDKNISNGILLFIKNMDNFYDIVNDLENNDKIKSITHINELEYCNVYYIKL